MATIRDATTFTFRPNQVNVPMKKNQILTILIYSKPKRLLLFLIFFILMMDTLDFDDMNHYFFVNPSSNKICPDGMYLFD